MNLTICYARRFGVCKERHVAPRNAIELTVCAKKKAVRHLTAEFREETHGKVPRTGYMRLMPDTVNPRLASFWQKNHQRNNLQKIMKKHLVEFQKLAGNCNETFISGRDATISSAWCPASRSCWILCASWRLARRLPASSRTSW